MTINEYQQLAMVTLNPELSKKDVLINGVMGLCGESGEAVDIVKKWLAQGHELDKEKLAQIADGILELTREKPDNCQKQGPSCAAAETVGCKTGRKSKD